MNAFGKSTHKAPKLFDAIAKNGKITASFSVVTRKNKINLSKYLGWAIIEENTPLYDIAKQIYGANKNNQLYSR